MRILRFFLLVASVVGVVYIFHALNIGSIPGTERSIAWLFGLGLVLNITFLLFCGPIVTGIQGSRIFFVFGTMPRSRTQRTRWWPAAIGPRGWPTRSAEALNGENYA